MVQEQVKQAEPKFNKAVAHLRDELKALRTGRATTALVDELVVEVYGQPAQLKTIATLAAPDAHTISITPWDRANLQAIEKAIRDSHSLGLTPNNDGHTIRLNIPPMTEERRRDVVKVMNEKVEACHIAIRNARHDVLNDVKKLERDKQATQDDVRWAEQELNRKIDQYRDIVEEIQKAKQKEIMEV